MRALLPLAVRFALRGRDARTRALLVALAGGFAVALLLLAVAVPGALAARNARSDARDPVGFDVAAPRTLADASVSLTVDGGSVSGDLVLPPGPGAPLPPGVTALPRAGAMLVSPALAAALRGTDGPLLTARLPYRVAGTIAPAGLLGPGELRFLAVDDRLPGSAVTHVARFGTAQRVEPLDPVLALLVAVGALLLLLPVLVVIGVVARFGSERRDVRLAALRLAGVGRGGVTALTLLEAVVAGLLGDVVGLVVFAGVRQLVGGITIASLSVYPGDVAPPPLAVLLVLLGAPLLAALAALGGLRNVAVEPLGVARRSGSRPRRVWWRLIPVVLALPLLATSIGAFTRTSAGSAPLVLAGVALLLLGVVALLPWIGERVVRLTPGGTLSWQLARGRMTHEGSTTARVLTAVAVALAGAITLQTLFAGLDDAYAHSTGARPGTELVTTTLPGPAAASLGHRLAARIGADSVTTEVTLAVDGRTDRFVQLVIGTCGALGRIAPVPACGRGGVTATAGPGTLSPGHRLRLAGRRTWRIPVALARTSTGTRADGAVVEETLLVPLGVLDPALVPQADVVAFTAGPRIPVAAVRTAAAADPLLTVQRLTATTVAHRFESIRRGLTVGLVLVLLLIAGVLLVAVAEQLQARRRALAALAALGTPRAVLARSILWEAGAQVLVGTLVGVVAGTVLGALLLRVVTAPAHLDVAGTAAAAGTALLVPLAVTALSLPLARRLMRPEGLRAE